MMCHSTHPYVVHLIIRSLGTTIYMYIYDDSLLLEIVVLKVVKTLASSTVYYTLAPAYYSYRKTLSESLLGKLLVS